MAVKESALVCSVHEGNHESLRCELHLRVLLSSEDAVQTAMNMKKPYRHQKSSVGVKMCCDLSCMSPCCDICLYLVISVGHTRAKS